MTETFYAIQQISTGKLMPTPTGRGGRGGTHVNFSDGGMPRLFREQHYAITALNWWLGGEVHVNYYQDHSGEYDEEWKVVKKADRDPTDCRVVEVNLTVVEGE